MPTKRPSIVREVQVLFDQAKAIGASRHKAKASGVLAGQRPQDMLSTIHSWGTYRREMQAAIQFAKWCRAAAGVRRVSQVTPEMVRKYIALRSKQVSPNTVTADLTGIRRLDKCLQASEPGRESIVPDDVSAPRRQSPRGAYEVGEALAIIDYVTRRYPLYGDVLRVQLAGGLRISEAVWLRSDCIDFRRGQIRVEIEGKGGKRRIVAVDPRLLARLDLADRFPLRPPSGNLGSRLMDKSEIRRIEALVKSACAQLGIPHRQTHGFRATAAITYYQSLISQGVRKREALKRTSEWLGHGANRWDVLRSYLGDALMSDALGER